MAVHDFLLPIRRNTQIRQKNSTHSQRFFSHSLLILLWCTICLLQYPNELLKKKI